MRNTEQFQLALSQALASSTDAFDKYKKTLKETTFVSADVSKLDKEVQRKADEEMLRTLGIEIDLDDEEALFALFDDLEESARLTLGEEAYKLDERHEYTDENVLSHEDLIIEANKTTESLMRVIDNSAAEDKLNKAREQNGGTRSAHEEGNGASFEQSSRPPNSQMRSTPPPSSAPVGGYQSPRPTEDAPKPKPAAPTKPIEESSGSKFENTVNEANKIIEKNRRRIASDSEDFRYIADKVNRHAIFFAGQRTHGWKGNRELEKEKVRHLNREETNPIKRMINQMRVFMETKRFKTTMKVVGILTLNLASAIITKQVEFDNVMQMVSLLVIGGSTFYLSRELAEDGVDLQRLTF